ncbi:hypothetical protein Bca4012_017539 [Brassica carinata]
MNPHSLALEEVNAATQPHRSMTSLYNQPHMPAIGLIPPHKKNGIGWGKHHQAVEMKSTAAMIASSPTNRRFCLAFVPYAITIFLAFSFIHICLKNYLQTISDCEKYLIFN